VTTNLKQSQNENVPSVAYGEKIIQTVKFYLMKNVVKNRKKYQDILYYMCGYFIINQNLPTLREVAEVMNTTKQSIANYINVLIKEGYLFEMSNKYIRKYGINYNKLTQLREHNTRKAFIDLGLEKDPLEEPIDNK
jgi:hypothetical protein